MAVDYIRSTILRDKQYSRLRAALAVIQEHLDRVDDNGEVWVRCLIACTVTDALADCDRMEEEAKRP